MPRRNHTTKRKFGYYTVRYIGADGLAFNVGCFQTRKEILLDIVLNVQNYPAGEGKIIYTY
jgi:hypothetical protein